MTNNFFQDHHTPKAMTGKQANPVQVPQNTSRKAHLES